MKAIGFKYLLVVALSLLLGLFYVRNIAAKTNNNDLIILTNKVTISNEEKDWVANLPEVKFLTSQAPPMSVLDPKSQKQVGIAIEVLKFIANDLGLKYSVENNSDLGLSNNIKAVQDGIFDAFVPLSLNAEREKSGLFSQPFYSSVYAIIANENNNYFIKNLNDLKKYKVGFFKGFALEQQLKQIMPDNQLYPIVSNQEEDLYTALYDNKVDVIVHNKDMFMEHKYIHEHFNLDIINTIYDYPRQYRFYFNANKTNEKLVELFDRYLLVMDTSGAYSKYRIGEKKLIQAYINQKNKQLAFKLFAFFIVFVLLIVIFFYRKNLLMARELYEANQELQKLYGTDPLTRLPNRHKLNEVLRKEYARYSRSKSPLSVLFIDADFFKAINDNYGHNVGDKYLIKMAQTLKESMRHRSNFVARFGGEEFVCLLPNTNSEQAIQMAKYIQKKINELNLRNPLSSTKVQTVSIGIITLIKENINIDEIISHADEQLYKAKKAGRNTIRSAVI